MRGARGHNPATIAQTRWQDLTEFDFRLGNEEYHQRISLFEVLEAWADTWEEIVGRELFGDDPVLVPASTGRLRWEADEHKVTRPKPLSLKAYYAVFRKRGAQAGYPWLSAPDATAEDGDDQTIHIETAF